MTDTQRHTHKEKHKEKDTQRQKNGDKQIETDTQKTDNKRQAHKGRHTKITT